MLFQFYKIFMLGVNQWISSVIRRLGEEIMQSEKKKMNETESDAEKYATRGPFQAYLEEL
jgi:hypothetical protein